MVLFGYGDFDYLCRHVPSYPVCNLFFRQLLVHPHGQPAPASSILGLPTDAAGLSTALKDAGVGVRPECAIPRMEKAGGAHGSLGNVANIVICAVSFFIALGLAATAGRRLAAVGRLEILVFFVIYALTCLFQIFDTGSFLKQGSTALTWVTGVHQGLIVGLFWTLAWVAFLALQAVEDGTMGSIVPFLAGLIIVTVGSTYIALDVGFTVTNFFQSSNPAHLHSAWLFSLLVVWPLVAIAFYLVVTSGVVVRILRERRPLILLVATVALFALSQGAYFGLSHKICTGSSSKVDGSFVATILETAAVVALFATWRTMTEDAWDDYTINSSGFLV